MSWPHSYTKSCKDLGRAEHEMFVLWTGLEAVPAVAILPALPLPSVPGDPKPTAPHTELSLCAELRGPSPRGFRYLCSWLFPVASVILDLLRDEKQVPSRCGQGPMAAQGPKHIPQAAGHETCRARRCSSAALRGHPGHRLLVLDGRCRPPESASP